MHRLNFIFQICICLQHLQAIAAEAIGDSPYSYNNALLYRDAVNDGSNGQTTQQSKQKKSQLWLYIAAGVAGGIVLIAIMVLAVCCCVRRRPKRRVVGEKAASSTSEKRIPKSPSAPIPATEIPAPPASSSARMVEASPASSIRQPTGTKTGADRPPPATDPVSWMESATTKTGADGRVLVTDAASLTQGANVSHRPAKYYADQSKTEPKRKMYHRMKPLLPSDTTTK